ncbi:hypothetical protein [Parendozoicomonas haliclonae]|uniref:Uncharacterized protein n=1 Tax=Parendozoicomonas haliclonae TaxID=1960125 RepID=A0A1X7AQ32_9GAMM|nr:hypothetical protein [Parendozoicomonas haliclonae]SMA50208.1 hypothetical protein EHSB41UT_04001 [Parendozoicomonas haliclonae]
MASRIAMKQSKQQSELVELKDLKSSGSNWEGHSVLAETVIIPQVSTGPETDSTPVTDRQCDAVSSPATLDTKDSDTTAPEITSPVSEADVEEVLGVARKTIYGEMLTFVQPSLANAFYEMSSRFNPNLDLGRISATTKQFMPWIMIDNKALRKPSKGDINPLMFNLNKHRWIKDDGTRPLVYILCTHTYILAAVNQLSPYIAGVIGESPKSVSGKCLGGFTLNGIEIDRNRSVDGVTVTHRFSLGHGAVFNKTRYPVFQDSAVNVVCESTIVGGKMTQLPTVQIAYHSEDVAASSQSPNTTKESVVTEEDSEL